jgi:hypothetical protein
MIDDLESMNSLNFETRQVLRWLLFRGPTRRIWPIVTLDINRVDQVAEWLESFGTIVYGYTKNDRLVKSLTNAQATTFSDLHAGVQFAIKENDQWLKFWLPEI